MTAHRSRSALLVALVAVLLTACGGDGDEADELGSPTEMSTDMSTEMSTEMSTGAEGETHDEMEMGGDLTWGEPADASAADRVLEIEATDDLRWVPDELEITPGETVTLRITNPGTVDHEFVLGDEETQTEMEEAMQAGTMPHDQPNTASVPAGGSVELTWTFNDEADGIIYGCHVAGHYAAGMKGTLTVG